MPTAISIENEEFLAQQIANGAYADRDEALNSAVELLRQQKELLDRLDEGRRQLDSGEGVDHDDESLQVFFDGLKQRVLERGSTASASS
jgi:Arc/MetJ-type ribon-helix-helix transcriptional regulator